MKVIVAADIHGVNGKLRSMLQELGDLTLLSPWSGDSHPYESEHEAVSAFHERNGFSEYERKIANVVNDQPALLIGFSVGATSLWRYIASPRCNPHSHAVLYYGSRIRESLALIPRCATSVVFAENEHSFLPNAIAPEISKSGANCFIIAGTHHGFMNPLSANYRAEIAQEQIALLKGIINPKTPRPEHANS